MPYKPMKFIDVVWFTEGCGTKNLFPCFGVVIVECPYSKERKAYIGHAAGRNEKDDIDNIMKYGAKISDWSLPHIVKLLQPELEDEGK